MNSHLIQNEKTEFILPSELAALGIIMIQFNNPKIY